MDTTIQISVRSLSDTDETILRLPGIGQGKIVSNEGKLFIRTDDDICFCDDTPEGKKLLRSILRGTAFPEGSGSEEQVWKELLTGAVLPSGLKKFGIRDDVPRCVILLQPLPDSRMKIQREMIPVEDDDRIAILDCGEAALVLNMKNRLREEACEYAAAAAETLESESGVSCHAGIGKTVGTAGQISESFREAGEAIRTGIRHRLPGRVFVYEKQTLERLTDLIPADKAEAFRKEVIPPQAEKALRGETLETIRVFFQNDLNLSTTARQLFIHRNTLLYRMEKIRKATGLDLRKFEDAAVFRMVMSADNKQD